MLKRTFLFIAAAMVIASCGKKDVSTCPDKVCTEEFAMITMLFKNKNGRGEPLSKLTVINKRTNKPVDRSTSATLDMIPGGYLIIDDRSTKHYPKTGTIY